jgi:hypothetical protein
MFSRFLPKVISVLQRAEVQLGTRIQLISPRRSSEEVDFEALQRELRNYEAVDEVCRETAAVLTQWLKIKFCDVPLVVPDKFCEPVYFRLRDATRLLLETGKIPPEISKSPDQIFTDLLINSWHTYAERYWRQRWRKASFGEAAGLPV